MPRRSIVSKLNRVAPAKATATPECRDLANIAAVLLRQGHEQACQQVRTVQHRTVALPRSIPGDSNRACFRKELGRKTGRGAACADILGKSHLSGRRKAGLRQQASRPSGPARASWRIRSSRTTNTRRLKSLGARPGTAGQRAFQDRQRDRCLVRPTVADRRKGPRSKRPFGSRRCQGPPAMPACL